MSKGEILLNNVNIKNYELESYRNSFGTVFQDYQVFAANIAENVIMDEVANNEKDIISYFKYYYNKNCCIPNQQK